MTDVRLAKAVLAVGTVLATVLGTSCKRERAAVHQDITPQEAHELLDTGQGYVYIDVRSIPEFVAGHPASARNVPLRHLNPSDGRLVPNPDFVRVVQANWTPNADIIVGCRSGARSAAAAKLLVEAGFAHVHNMHGGFGGATDETGTVVQPGWAALGFPVSTDNGDGVSYESLSASSATP